jgi:hypothetical protein
MDFCNNGNDASLYSTYCSWRRSNKGLYLQQDSANRVVTIASDPSINPSDEITILVFMETSNDYYNVAATVRWIMAKNTTGSFDYAMAAGYLNTRFYFRSNNFVYVAADPSNKQSFCVSLVSGEGPKFYLDGVYVGQSGTACTLPANGYTTYIGGQSNTGLGVAGVMWKAYKVFHGILEEDQIADVHHDIKKQVTLRARPSYFVFPPSPTYKDAIGAWDGSVSGDTLVDVSGNNHNSTTTIVNQERTKFGSIASFNGRSTDVLFGDVGDFENLSAATVCFWAKNSDWTGTQYWIHKDASSGNDKWSIYSDGTDMNFAVGDGTDTQTGTQSLPSDDDFHFFLCEFSGTNVTAYMDNVAGTPVAQVGNMGGAGNANNFEMGYSTVGTTGRAKGSMCRIKFFDRVLTAGERFDLYMEGAKAVNLLDGQQGCSNSTADESGVTISDTTWLISTGSWRLRDKTGGPAGERELRCESAGIIYRECEQAYGTWEFELYKAADANSMLITFIADTIGTYNSAGQDGYYMAFNASEQVVLGESVNGTPNSFSYSDTAYIANTTWYKYRVTRRYDGQFTYYIKGGAYTNWHQVSTSGGSGTNPSTDNTTTSSKYFCVDLDTDDRIANFKFLHGVVEP